MPTFFYNFQMIVIQDTQKQLIEFISSLFMNSCKEALNPNYQVQKHEQFIIESLKSSKFFYNQIKKYVGLKKNDFIADLLEITEDMKIVYRNCEENKQKFINRAYMHFSGEHFLNFQKEVNDRRTKNVLKMYQNQPFNWSWQKQFYFLNYVYPSCAYFMGVNMGNGVIIRGKFIMTCAHIFIQEQTNDVFKTRCFSTPLGGFGVVKTQQSGLFRQQDVGFAEIIAYQGPQLPYIQLQLSNLINFQFFRPVACIQVGLLSIPDESHEVFETAEGFIQQCEYENEKDISLNDEMGKFIHSCYGMWGTSGSPIWDSWGRLLGIHNAWNDQKQNISMIVHEEQQQGKCQVIKQYQRRAVSTHVYISLYNKWMQNNSKLSIIPPNNTKQRKKKGKIQKHP